MEPDPTIRQTGEDALVARLLPLMPSNAFLVTGPGDDCAVTRSSGNRQLLLKTDCVVEGMHFLPGTDPELIGRKALARAVSDIAAMGGTPLHALVTLFVHADRPVSQVEGIYRGMGRLARQFGISIAGGESSGLPEDGLIISVALTGEVAEGKAVLRSTARAGDLLAVTGVLGGSFPTGHHLSFIPRPPDWDSAFMQNSFPCARASPRRRPQETGRITSCWSRSVPATGSGLPGWPRSISRKRPSPLSGK